MNDLFLPENNAEFRGIKRPAKTAKAYASFWGSGNEDRSLDEKHLIRRIVAREDLGLGVMEEKKALRELQTYA